jgi:hypothetical protein
VLSSHNWTETALAGPAAVELAEGRLRFSGALPPEGAVSDPDGLLALLDTEVYWEVA